MIIKPTYEDLVTYRDYPALNQSFLKSILAGDAKPFKETVATILGSYLDCQLFTPEFTQNLFAQDLEKRPSDKIKQFLDDTYFSLVDEDYPTNIGPLETYKNLIINKCREEGYQKNWGDDAIWNSIIKDGEDYWNNLIISQGKKIITKDEMTQSDLIASLTLSSFITGKYFIDQPNVDKYFQLPIYWTYKDEPCKGLIDNLIVEHETKTIYLTDLKSTQVSDIQQWFITCRQKNYPFQLSFYREGVIQNFQDLIDKGYIIKCRWVVVPFNTFNFKPWIVPCTDMMLKHAKTGLHKFSNMYKDQQGEIKYYGYKNITGWEEAINIYKIAKSEGLTDFDLSHYFYQGKIPDHIVETHFYG